MKLTLPVPPSANELFIQRGKRRVKTPKYRAWLEECRWLVKLGNKKLPGPVTVSMLIPENKRRDIDNHAKPILDLLVSCDAIENDNGRIVRGLTMAWHDGDMVEVTVEEAKQ